MKKFRFLIVALMILMVPSLVFATAETLTGTRAAKSFPVAGEGIGGSMKVSYGSYEAGNALETSDVFLLCKVPRGAAIVGGMLYVDDLDTGTEVFDMDIGWIDNGSDGASAAALLNCGVLTGDAVTGYKPETGTMLPFGGIILKSGSTPVFTRETQIAATVNTAPNVGATGTISVVVHYTMDNQ